MKTNRSKFAPEGYEQHWQFAPRRSGLPPDYFAPRLTRRTWGALLAAFVAALFLLALTVAPGGDEVVRAPSGSAIKR